MAKNVVRQDVVQVAFDVPENPFKGITDDLNGMKKLASDAVGSTENSVKGLQGVAKGVQDSFAGIKKAAKLDNILDGIDSDLDKFNTKLKVAKDKFDSFKASIKNITLHPIKTMSNYLSGLSQITSKLSGGNSGIKGFATSLKNIGKISLVKTVSGLKTVASKLTEIGKKAASMAFNGLKKVAGVSFKAMTAGLAAAATGVGAIVTKSVQSFADFEQYKGGMEKIFDNADTTTILKDANNAYKDLGMTANQYLSAINSTGATFASTMGDQKGYDTARLGMKAISDYATGTGKNINELNDKFTLITRSTSSYQSIADQFSGILPATSKDFLAQAKAAGFLKKGYSELTEVPVAEYQEAVAKMLEKGVTELGLAGNTAMEAEKTLSGSLGMVKSAWGNLITAIGSGENLDQTFENFISSATAFGKQLIPVVERSLSGISKLITELAPTIAKELPTLVNTLLPPLISAAVQILQEIANALPNLISTLLPIAINAILQLIGGILTVLDTSGVDIINAILNGLMQAIDGIISILPQFIQTGIRLIVALIVGIVQKLPELIPVLIEGFFTAIGSLIEMIPEIFSGLWNAITSINWIDLGKQIINSIWEGIKSIGSSLWEGVKGLFSDDGGGDLSSKGASAGTSYASGLTNSINSISLDSAGSKITSGLTVDLTSTGTTTAQTYTTAMNTGLTIAVTDATTTGTNITKEFASLDLTNEGADTVQGLINGMNSKKSAAVETARSIANAINAEYRKIQDINSPSGEWEKYGSYQIQGDIKGMKKELPKLKSAVAKAGETAMPTYTPDSPTVNNSRTSYNTTTYSPMFTLNMNGASATEANARKVKRMVQEAIKESFNSMSRVNPQLMEV